ncbi:MAG: MFS transporter [Acidimicrobiales bacterium]
MPAKAWVALAISAAGQVLFAFNLTATNIAFEDIGRTFPDETASTLSWVATVFLIGSASLLLVSGRVADRIGRRRVFNVGLGLFAISAVVSAVAPNVYLLIFGRFLGAAASAMVIPSGLAMILPLFPKARHGTAVGAWSSAAPIASIIAPSLSALVIDASSWRWLYAIGAPAALLALLAGIPVLAETRAPAATGRLDLLGAASGTVAIALMVFVVANAANLGITSAPIVAAAIGAAVLLPTFIRRCQRHPQPLLNLQLFKIRAVWSANLANWWMGLVGTSTWLIWPLFFARIWGYDKAAIGGALTIGPIFAFTFTTLGGRLVDRFGARRVAVIGSLGAPVSLGWPLLFLDATPNYWLSAAPSIAFYGASWAATMPPLQSGILRQVPASVYGEASAAFNTVRNVAGAVGIAGALSIIGDADRPDAVAAYDRVWLVSFVAVVLCMLTIILLYPSDRPARASRSDR